jgi:hypothetical protein
MNGQRFSKGLSLGHRGAKGKVAMVSGTDKIVRHYVSQLDHIEKGDELSLRTCFCEHVYAVQSIYNHPEI